MILVKAGSLPADGLGWRGERFRPVVTGGLGWKAPIFVDLILEQRIYGDFDREFLDTTRIYVDNRRRYATTAREYDYWERLYAHIERQYITFDRSYVPLVRAYGTHTRPTSGSRTYIDPDESATMPSTTEFSEE